MDVTLPNGVVIEGVPEGTTQAEVMRRAVAGGLITAQEAADALAGPRRQMTEPSTGEIALRSAARGVSNVPALLSGLLSSTGFVPGAEANVAAAGGRPTYEPQTFATGETRVREPVLRAAGVTNVAPATMGQSILGGGLEAVFDPSSYLLGGTGLFRGPAARVFGAPVEQFAIGAGAESGSQLGRTTGLPGAEIVGGLLGGAGTSYMTGQSRRVADLTGKGLSAANKKVRDLTGTVPQDEMLRDVNTRINNIFAAAAAADPNFMTILEKAAKAQQSVSLKAPGAPQVQLPLNALLADNPVINSFIQNLSSRDPKFQALYGSQFEAAKNALRENQIRLFGDPSQVSLTGISRADAAAQARATEKSVQRQVRSLDQQIADAYSGQTDLYQTPTDVGLPAALALPAAHPAAPRRCSTPPSQGWLLQGQRRRLDACQYHPQLDHHGLSGTADSAVGRTDARARGTASQADAACISAPLAPVSQPDTDHPIASDWHRHLAMARRLRLPSQLHQAAVQPAIANDPGRRAVVGRSGSQRLIGGR